MNIAPKPGGKVETIGAANNTGGVAVQGLSSIMVVNVVVAVIVALGLGLLS